LNYISAGGTLCGRKPGSIVESGPVIAESLSITILA
jgi:hypothetical protein